MTDLLGDIDSAGLSASNLAPIGRILRTLQNEQPRIVANWSVRVSTLPAYRADPRIELGDLQRHIPELLGAALDAVAISDSSVDPEPRERAAKLAAAHGSDRGRHAFSIDVVLAEFQALYREVWSAMWRTVERAPGLLSTVRQLESRLSETFDALTIAAAEAWVAELSRIAPVTAQ